MEPLHCIVNPASRDWRCGKDWPIMKQKLELAGFEVIEHITERIGHGAEIANELSNDPSLGDGQVIVAVGGDGIVHEVASGIRGSKLVLGQLPYGSGNDYCITHGIPRNNLDEAIEILKSGKDRSCGAWRIEAFPAEGQSDFPSPTQREFDGESVDERVVRWIFLETDAGITSAISRAKLSRAKWLHGPKKYTYLGITTIPFWPRRKVSIKFDESEAQTLDLSMLAACTGETFGGGYRVCPGMSPISEDASVVIAPRLSRIQMLSLMGPVAKGKHIGKWGIYEKRCKSIEIFPIDKNGNILDKPDEKVTWIQTDGEPVLQLPAKLDWHTDQIIVRGNQSLPWD
ncbi:MAG: diacylglycerol/lipid kinase family protein [Candidatus Poseidoniaceae archaeon]